MKTVCKVAMATAGLLVAGCLIAANTAKKDARITRIIREVKILPPDAAPQPAVIDATVQEDTGVRTGDRSRSELTFADLTITRLGANTLFHFNRAGRNVDMASGSMLLRVPKDSGGGTINGSAVTVAITGTTVIFEGNRAGRSKLIVLEGGARARLIKYPKHSQYVRAGQMLDVKAGATSLPRPVNIDLRRIMKTDPLITDFPPLPSQNLILAAIRDQQNQTPRSQPVYPGRPVAISPISRIVGSGWFKGGGRSSGGPGTFARPSGSAGHSTNSKKARNQQHVPSATQSITRRPTSGKKPTPAPTF